MRTLHGCEHTRNQCRGILFPSTSGATVHLVFVGRYRWRRLTYHRQNCYNSGRKWREVTVVNRIYRWHEWFRKRQFILRRGLDYKCPQGTMVQQVRNAAVKYKVRVSIFEADDG